MRRLVAVFGLCWCMAELVHVCTFAAVGCVVGMMFDSLCAFEVIGRVLDLVATLGLVALAYVGRAVHCCAGAGAVVLCPSR